MVKILRFIVNALLVIIIFLLLIYLLFKVTNKVEIYRVKTGSMEEKIHVGDYILIYRQESYNVGEVVTYTSNEGFITHRIIRKDGNKIITKGDANDSEDNEIIESTIVGKVIMSGGTLNFIITYKYLIVCVLLSLYLFSCYFGDGNQEKDTNVDELEKELVGSSEENDETLQPVVESLSKEDDTLEPVVENLSEEESKSNDKIKNKKVKSKKEKIVK